MTIKSEIQAIGLACLALAVTACAGAPAPSATETNRSDAHTNPEPAPEQTRQRAQFPGMLSLCPRMTVSNAPASSANRNLAHYQPFVSIAGSRLAVAPVERGCLSSGFGLRGEKLHKGIDLYNRDTVKIYAAANGRVKEKHYRDDYGNMLVIEHGDGVFARYAHLDSFASDINVGDQVTLGQTIGIMGNTASYPIPRHLHYEVMTGEWGALSGAFGLTPVDIIAHLQDN